MAFMDFLDCTIIGNHQALKAHFLPEKTSQDFFRAGHRNPVNGAVARHNSLHPSFGNCRLKRPGINLPKQPLRYIAGCRVNSSLRVMISEKMFGCSRRSFRQIPILLDSLHISASHRGSKRRILPIGFPLPSEPGVPGNIQHRGKCL